MYTVLEHRELEVYAYPIADVAEYPAPSDDMRSSPWLLMNETSLVYQYESGINASID
jgi:hypothetical protein